MTIHNRLRDVSARLSRAFRSRAPKPYHLDAAILIRQSDAFDEVALQRLATLDGRKLPEGTFLVAEVDGELVAAAPLDVDAELLNDPLLLRSGNSRPPNSRRAE